MTATATDIASSDLRPNVLRRFRRKRLFAFSIPVILALYGVYVFFAFDIAGLAQRARMDNAVTLMSDAISYKTHVTRDNRNDEVQVSIEGSRRAIYDRTNWPDWVQEADDVTLIDLGGGHRVTYEGPVLTYDLPGYGIIRIEAGDSVLLDLPTPDVPDFINATDSRVVITTAEGRITATRSRFDTFRYFYGWEMFFFDLSSPFSGKSPAQIAALAFSGDRVDPSQPNFTAILNDFWFNGIWRHGEVVWAIFETVLMAFLGTFGAAFIALPLAFFAAQNFAPSRLVRFAVRRFFDFVRGVDALIFTIILSRAFGPGPMTGALAILITDSGSFGKLFSEALENVNTKPVEGVRSTGANAIQRHRFGVIPQVMPVLLSQMLYFLESNTRSATIIGAIVGGGIGLMLTQAIQTTSDWEKVTYYILLVVLMVIAMDTLSGWLRRKLIKGDAAGH